MELKPDGIPSKDLEGVEEGSLIEIVKGVFGLSTSPRLWWDKLAKTLLEVRVTYNNMELKLVQHELDSCLFLLQDEKLEQKLSNVFPIDAWEDASNGLEYCGASVKQEKENMEDKADEVAKMDNQSTIGALSEGPNL